MSTFDFTKSEYLHICDECMLNEEYKKLLEMKIKGYSRTKIALELNVSEPTLDVMIKKLKNKIKKTLKNNKLFLVSYEIKH